MRFQDEFFGSGAQQTVSRRARDLWQLCAKDGQLAYNGRIVTVVGDIGAKTADKLICLARLQGSTTCHFLPIDKTEAVKAAVEASGLSSNVWQFCTGGQSAYDAACQILETYQLPPDLTVKRIDARTDAFLVAGFAKMAADCGVLAMAGRVIRGLDVEGITLAAVDKSGQPVASAWGYKCYPEQSAFSEYAFWGGLSCRKDRRGQKIALILGAIAIVQLWEELQVRGFCTGVTAGNTASFSVCEKLGVLSSNWVGLGVTDPTMFNGGTLTK